MAEKIEIKINVDFAGFSKGQIISVNRGDAFWARRLRDAKIDGCCELVQARKTKGGKPQAEAGE